MEREQSVPRNFLRRLRRLSIKRRKKKPLNSRREELENCNVPIINEQERGSCDDNNKSFPGLKKLHIRIKKYMFKQNRTQQIPENSRPVELPSSSVSYDLEINDTSDEGDANDLILCNSPSDIIVPGVEINHLYKALWYWGPLSRSEAEEKLKDSLDGTFLVRDSGSTNYLFSVSFRTLGKTFHARIDYNMGNYSLFDQVGFPSVYELINHAIRISDTEVYCYTISRSTSPDYPVRFLRPLSRYTFVPTLRHLCRFVIRQCINNKNDISSLPLPAILNTYLQETSYF